MAGNEFEEYLAFLLEKLSYENVKVTSVYSDRLKSAFNVSAKK